MQSHQNNLINIDENSDIALMNAVELFRSGKVFIYPTDTIYGVGGNPFDEDIVKRINLIKGRDLKKEFIWLLSDFENVMNYTEITFKNHLEFLEQIWPAPVTVVLNLNERTKEIAKQDTAAIRIPQNDFCLQFLREISRPLISTSVNRSGNAPLIQIQQIINDFSQDVDAIIYSSKSIGSISSTIIDLTSEQPKLIREGSIKFVELLQKLS